MADDITNRMLLGHMQAMKNELLQKIMAVEGGWENMGEGLQQLKIVIQRLEQKVDRGFEEATQHRQALQEDLEATMQLQLKQQRKLERISV